MDARRRSLPVVAVSRHQTQRSGLAVAASCSGLSEAKVVSPQMPTAQHRGGSYRTQRCVGWFGLVFGVVQAFFPSSRRLISSAESRLPCLRFTLTTAGSGPTQ